MLVLHGAGTRAGLLVHNPQHAKYDVQHTNGNYVHNEQHECHYDAFVVAASQALLGRTA